MSRLRERFAYKRGAGEASPDFEFGGPDNVCEAGAGEGPLGGCQQVEADGEGVGGLRFADYAAVGRGPFCLELVACGGEVCVEGCALCVFADERGDYAYEAEGLDEKGVGDEFGVCCAFPGGVRGCGWVEPVLWIYMSVFLLRY